MRYLLHLYLIVLPLFILQSCQRDDSALQVVRRTMETALDDLQRGDCQAYFNHMDFGCEMDSVKSSLFLQAIVQQQSQHILSGKRQTGARVVEVRMESDTVAIAYYRQYFSNGDSLDKAQKLVRIGEQWKLRMRN